MDDCDWDEGYSATPLPRKLGVASGRRIAVVSEPDGFVERGLGPLPDDTTVVEGLNEPVDLAIAFITSRAELAALLPDLQAATAPDGAFWVAWPKRTSGVPTDLTEDGIRELALPRGLVDNKVCAMNDTWSGLRLSLRRELRGR